MIPLYPLLRPLLFALEPEVAHRTAVGAARLAGHVPGLPSAVRASYGYDHPSLRTSVLGLDFANPVGLAAGFDKDGVAVPALGALGFGFLEVGTVTPRAQPGNPRPRLFRLPEDGAAINRMGFNNAGVLAMARRLERVRRGVRVGVNLGKNVDTPLVDAVSDYLTALHAVYPRADYLVVNLSSPNTPGLRTLQEKPALAAMAAVVRQERDKLREATGHAAPFLVKIAPDLSEGALADVVEVALDAGVDGLVATNTTLAREGLRDRHREQAGGLSGRPLHAEALRTVGALHRLSGGRVPLIGVGGVDSAAAAYAMLRAGASLVQVYTGLIYRGPALVRTIKRGLVSHLERDGFATVAEAVGTAAPAT